MSNLTMTDLFCGAGGSSTGATAVPGVSVRMAANHWRRAIETHNANHPATDHDCADISQVDPRRYPSTDILWASPECTNHSRAKGRKAHRQPDLFGEVLPDEAAERSRATMWDVVRFAEQHDYRAVLVENVVEVADWSSPTGIAGGLFTAWLGAMHAMGYRHRIISLNSMHASATGLPAPQSRDRVYIAFTKQGERAPDFEHLLRPLAYCPTCDRTVRAMQWWKKGRGDGQDRPGRYRQQYLYRCPATSCRNTIVEPAWLPAASVIDWTLPGTRIGDRARPLADKTRRRIAAGIARYWHQQRRALAVPVEGRDGKHATPTTGPLRTQTTRLETALAMPHDQAPFIAELRGGGSTARPAARPLSTVTAEGNHHGLVTRHNTSRGDGAEMTTPAAEPLRTLTTTAQQSVITPGDLDAAAAEVDDCLFRMLEPAEVKRGMAFPDTYVMHGNRREQVRLAGNAVTPPAARDLLTAVTAAITGETTQPANHTTLAA